MNDVSTFHGQALRKYSLRQMIIQKNEQKSDGIPGHFEINSNKKINGFDETSNQFTKGLSVI